MSIIKRRKTSQFAQIHNDPLQNLEDIRSIGLLAHLMSLPETWVIRKMQLYRKFGRAAVSHGVNELEAKKLWVDVKYRDGKNNEHIYHISDQPFGDDEVKDIILEVMETNKVMEVSPPFSHVLSIVENQQLKESRQINVSSIVDFEQLKMNCSKSIVENEHVLNKQLEINNNKEININTDIFGNKLLTRNEVINNLVLEYMKKGLSKELCLKVLNEVDSTPSVQNFGGYFRTCLENTLTRVRIKNGEIVEGPNAAKNIETIDGGIPFYNWLNE